MPSPRLRIFFHWIPAIFAVAMIAFESTATMSAANTSRWLLPIWIHLFGPITPGRWDVVHHYIRKTGHFIGYGFVSLCFFYGWRFTLHSARVTMRALWARSASLAVACTILVASADEFHQTFLPGRTGTPRDVVLDTCGAITVQLLILALLPLFSRRLSLRTISA
jgi:VanZ family protein